LNISAKGLSVYQFFKQLFANLFDGASMSICDFDRKKKNIGYAYLLENSRNELAESHQVKRFFTRLGRLGRILFRKILRHLFIWRLRLANPSVIILVANTMALDNGNALKLEVCEPTYKKVKGF